MTFSFVCPFKLSHTKYFSSWFFVGFGVFLMWCSDRSDSVVYAMVMAVVFLHCIMLKIQYHIPKPVKTDGDELQLYTS